jgi:hypothetical protein
MENETLDAGGAEMVDAIEIRRDSFLDVRAAANAWLIKRGLASDGESTAARRAASERAERGDVTNTYSPNQFADLIGKTPTWVSHQIRAGIIKADVRFGSVFIPSSELPRYLATLSNKPSK